MYHNVNKNITNMNINTNNKYLQLLQQTSNTPIIIRNFLTFMIFPSFNVIRHRQVHENWNFNIFVCIYISTSKSLFRINKITGIETSSSNYFLIQFLHIHSLRIFHLTANPVETHLKGSAFLKNAHQKWYKGEANTPTISRK